MMTEQDELLDLVDKNDQVIGTILRSQTGDLKTGYLRAAELFIQNSQGNLWVPRRQMHKRIEPGGLDYSAAGHVASGEDYKTTLIREVAEELNLKMDESRLSFLKKFPPRPDLPPYFRAVYIYQSDEVPKYNPDDFSEYHWMTPQELLDKLKAGEPAKKSLTETAEFLTSHKR